MYGEVEKTWVVKKEGSYKGNCGVTASIIEAEEKIARKICWEYAWCNWTSLSAVILCLILRPSAINPFRGLRLWNNWKKFKVLTFDCGKWSCVSHGLRHGARLLSSYGVSNIKVQGVPYEEFIKEHFLSSYPYEVTHKYCGKTAFYVKSVTKDGYPAPTAERIYPDSNIPVYKTCSCFGCGKQISAWEKEDIEVTRWVD